jgi:hypothetical protein
MRITSWLIEKQIAACMVLLLAAPVARAKPLSGQETVAGQEAQETPPTSAQQGSSSPGATTPSPSAETPTSSDTPAPDAETAQNSDQNAPLNTSQAGSGGSQASPAQDESNPAKPVGTAAAPAAKGTGVSGSRVSGAAIAPAKQRRVHTFLIRVAVVVAACVAVGTVVALTHATPSEPR